jgi:hypothetical protein
MRNKLSKLSKDTYGLGYFEHLRSKTVRVIGASALVVLSSSACKHASERAVVLAPSPSKLASPALPAEAIRCTGLTIDNAPTKTVVTAQLDPTTGIHSWRSHMIENSASGDFPPVSYDSETAGLSVPISLHAPFDGLVTFSITDSNQPGLVINCPPVLGNAISQK